MTSFTPRLAIPYPDPADDVANEDLQVKALATKLDGLASNLERAGRTTGTTDANGDLTINHGLGVTPTTVMVGSGVTAGSHCVAAHTFTNTTFKIRCRQSTTSALIASTANVVVDWRAVL